MNLKYYLRGLGIGIIVTAVIMGVSGSKQESLSDREIKERAAALGMIEPGNSLADMEAAGLLEASITPEAAMESDTSVQTLSPEPEPTVNEEDGKKEEEGAELEPEATEKPEASEEPVQEPGEESEPAQEPEITEPQVQEPDAQKTNVSDGEEIITIVVETGESSFSICQKLEDAGLIELASQFDAYLYANEYDKKLRFGSYEIPAGSDWETIVEILTHM